MRSRIAVFAVAVTLAACAPSPKSSSETHFLDCAKDVDCAELGAAYVCIQSVCGVGPDLTQTKPLVTSGVCVGDGLTCAALSEAATFVPGPEVRCDIPEPVPAKVKWTADLGTVDCRVGKCPASNPTLAVAQDGTVWAAVDLLPPPPIVQGITLGRALLRFDSEGRRTLVTAITLQGSTLIPLKSPLLGAARAVRIDERGHAHLFADSKEAFDAYNMSEYDAAGRLVRVQRLVESVSQMSAAFVADGSILLGYTYRPPQGAGVDAAPPTELMDMALLDPQGSVVWNRGGSPVPGGIVAPVFIPTGPKRAALLSVFRLDSGSPSHTLLKVADDGSLSGGILFPQTVTVRTTATEEGSALVESTGDASGTFLDLLDGAGHGLWRMPLEAQHASDQLLGERRGTSILFEMSLQAIGDSSSVAPPLQALMVSADGQRCFAASVDAPHCLEVDASGSPTAECDVLQIAPASDDDLYIATRATIIRATLGAAP